MKGKSLFVLGSGYSVQGAHYEFSRQLPRLHFAHTYCFTVTPYADHNSWFV